MTDSNYLKNVESFFDADVDRYLKGCYEGDGRYPTNYFRKEAIIYFINKYCGIDDNGSSPFVLDAGCGTGIIMLDLLSQGYNVSGIDISDGMLQKCKSNLKKHGFKKELIVQGDVLNIRDYFDRKFDIIIAAGVTGYLPDHKRAFFAMKEMLSDGGIIVCDMNNNLMDMFTLNKYTINFYNNLFKEINIPSAIRKRVVRDIESIILPKKTREYSNDSFRGEEVSHKGDIDENYNALNFEDRFKEYGLSILDKRFIHKHPIPTIFEENYKDIFVNFAIGLEEKETNQWYDAIICNAAVLVLQSM